MKLCADMLPSRRGSPSNRSGSPLLSKVVSEAVKEGLAVAVMPPLRSLFCFPAPTECLGVGAAEDGKIRWQEQA